MKLSEYCECGGQMVGSIRPDSKAASLIRIFWEQHQGIGHGKCTATKCYTARRKAERIGVKNDGLNISRT